MSAVLTACCGHCGKAESVPAPCVADILRAGDELAERGWLSTRCGCFCSEACAEAEKVPAEPKGKVGADDSAMPLFGALA